MNIEKVILKNLLLDEEYSRKVIPFLNEEYFTYDPEKQIFSLIKTHFAKYNSLPNKDSVHVEINKLENVNEKTIEETHKILGDITNNNEKTNQDWLLKTTEEFCQEKGLYLSILQSIDIINNKNTKLKKGIIPELLTKALSISFDPNIGHDYFEDIEKRYAYYHQILDRIPFDLEFFNKITKNGLPKKTLSVILAGTGVGKSLLMCHMATAALVHGKNVLYITLEMAEEEIGKRIDANLMNITIDDLMELPEEMFLKKGNTLKTKTNGKLIIKEYPTASASTMHFRGLLNELRLKKNFVPDILFVDYINICLSSRIRIGSNVNSYTYIKFIAEELRGLAGEFKIPVVTATQTNREGFASSDVDLTNTAESFGLPATADLMFALITSEELEGLNQMMVKQLKNRFNDLSKNRRFIVGIDKDKMKLYDVEEQAQKDIVDSGQEKDYNKDKFKKLKV